MARTAHTPRTRRTAVQRRTQGRSHCLSILRRLSAYLDNELGPQVCEEIRRHLGTCPNCETFVASLQQTVTLCRAHHPSPLSRTEKVALRRKIFTAVAQRPRTRHT